ncbi:MAG: hypothetical protein ACPL0B_00320 [Anaerolineales bacterium]
MPNLAQSLSKYDLGFLRIIAQLWGIELRCKNRVGIVQELSEAMLQSDNLNHVLAIFPEEALQILADLQLHNGKIKVSLFERKYGGIRKVGQGKRDREAIFLHPINAAEYLWYRGFIFRDFFSIQDSIEEYIYCPIELQNLLPSFSARQPLTQIHPAHPEHYQRLYKAEDRLVDDSCTVLAWYRKGSARVEIEINPFLLLGEKYQSGTEYPISSNFLHLLLESCGLITADTTPIIEAIRSLLADERENALRKLFQGWLNSEMINELRLLPEIECVGDWHNDAIQTRQFILQQVFNINADHWYDLDEFIQYIHETNPDFQRPSENYETWLIRDKTSGEFLKGFESWKYVEGRLLRYFLCGPLYWFGIVELGSSDEQKPILAFRISSIIKEILTGDGNLSHLPKEEDKLRLQSNGKISASRFVPRTARYQIARFCEWLEIKKEEYIFQITAQSLTLARQQNLLPRQLLSLLRKNAHYFPSNISKALLRWETQATEIQIYQSPILQVRSPEILVAIQNSRLARHIQNIISPTVAILIPGSETIVQHGLIELGFIAELKTMTPHSTQQIDH